jgi:hypothetical protein
MLLKKQKNELLEIMTDRSIFPHQVTKKDSTARLFEIKLNDTPFFFRVTPHQGSLGGDYDVEALPNVTQEGIWGETWQSTIEYFKSWASAMQEELDAPDLWAEATKTAQLFAPNATPSDDKFTQAELAEVQGQLRILAQSFAMATLPEAAKQKLIELTHTAAVAAETATKRDWIGIIVGSFTGAVFSLALNPTQASEVIKLVKTAFGGLFLH